jgi:hypothetical protein
MSTADDLLRRLHIEAHGGEDQGCTETNCEVVAYLSRPVADSAGSEGETMRVLLPWLQHEVSCDYKFNNH